MPRAKTNKPSLNLDQQIMNKLANMECKFVKYEREYEGNTIYRVYYICHCGAQASVLDNGIIKRTWRGCKACIEKSRTAARAEKYGNILKDKGHEMISLAGDVVTYKCSCGETAKTNVRNLKKLISCIKCSNKVRGNFRGFDHAQRVFKAAGVDLPEQDYIDNKAKLWYICPLCDEKAHVSLSELNRGRRCEVCAKKRMEETNLKRYGARNVMHNSEIFAKASTNTYKRKTFCFPSGRTEICQGYEPECFYDLLSEYTEDDIIVGWPSEEEGFPAIYYDNPETDKKSRYYPDGYIKSTNTVIEVKSTRTYEIAAEKNEVKFKRVQEMGYNLELHIYGQQNKRGKVKLLELRRYPATQQSP